MIDATPNVVQSPPGLSVSARGLVVVIILVASAWTPRLCPGQLPLDHEYQQQLRSWLGSLTPEDLTIQIRPFHDPGERTARQMHRLWALTLGVPPFDVGLPAERFLLERIEADESVRLPRISCSATAWLTQWEDPINPYFGDAALKRRAVVWAVVDLMMLDQWHEQGQGRRSDYLGGTLIWLAYVLRASGDVLPEPVRKAYEQGLLRMVNRLHDWGPTGLMTDMDLFAPVGLWYAAEAIGDEALYKLAENYSRPLFTAPRFFHPAGYFVDAGGYDVSYNGISLYFAAHAAAATRWDFAIDALSRAYELRRYLVFPDPASHRSWGPAHFSPRTSAGAEAEQWGRPIRHVTAAMFTDQAMSMVPLPTGEMLQESVQRLMKALEGRNRPGDGEPQPWRESHWSSDLPYAYDNYLDGFYERRLAIQRQNPEVLVEPFRRPGSFIRNFADTLLVSKQPAFGVIIHTGPIGTQSPRIYGLSGGSLSGFWTPKAGPVLLGRRSGAQGHANPDDFDNWKLWPSHATSGVTAEGSVFSSGRIRLPKADYRIVDDSATVTVSAAITRGEGANRELGVEQLIYQRVFELDETGLSIQTTLKASDSLRVSELYESLPVFLGLPHGGNPSPVHLMLGRIDGGWAELSGESAVDTDLVRVERADGAIHLHLDRRRPVRLSPTVWQDNFQSKVMCRNLMIDLLDGADRPGTIDDLTVRYKISAADDVPIDRNTIAARYP